MIVCLGVGGGHGLRMIGGDWLGKVIGLPSG
jgi:hypothetical protein